MGWKGIRRNELDFILTDILPVELSDLFSFKEFYEFLNEKQNKKILDEIIYELKKIKNENNKLLFEGNWDTVPLKYSILKGMNSFRKMSVVQPLSAINLYLFIELYQNEILNYFEKNHCFSLRYHKKNSNLYYKGKIDKIINYFGNTKKKFIKLGIQQTGIFFKIAPYESINSFAESSKWRISNFNYPYYAKVDYKSCFDSIYTHSFKWIVSRNVTDSKGFKNSSLFSNIDRILQNINGKSTNGLIVGPEFSRMIAEILLQHIDEKVKLSLAKKSIIQNKDYVVYRYVDDIFIFGKSKEIVNSIIGTFTFVASEYLIQLNEFKLIKGETPFLPKEWLRETRNVSDVINDWFYSEQEYKMQSENEKYLVKKNYVSIDRIKDEIIVLIKAYESDKRTIVSFLLSTILNNVSRQKDGYTLFDTKSSKSAYKLIDVAIFIYAFYPSYEQTRKLISMIVYINNELNFKEKDSKQKEKLQILIKMYSFIFSNGNIFDLIDWFAFLFEYKILLDINIEEEIVEKAYQLNDPIVWANLLLYSEYNSKFHNKIKKEIEKAIESALENIADNKTSIMLSREIWFILIFHNCDDICSNIKDKIYKKIDNLKNINNSIQEKAIGLIYDFLKRKDKKSFFNWSKEDVGDRILYKTHQRTIFKKYNKKTNRLFTSLE